MAMYRICAPDTSHADYRDTERVAHAPLTATVGIGKFHLLTLGTILFIVQNC